MSERVIKFRAWSKPYRRMYDVTMFQWSAAVPGELNKMELLSLDELHEIRNVYDQAIQDNYVLMQYTGLQDSQGQEIYEGDIVRINHPADRTGDFTNAIGKVFWWTEEGGWYHTNNHDRPPKRMWQYVEVIGNVYENPDLLNKE